MSLGQEWDREKEKDETDLCKIDRTEDYLHGYTLVVELLLNLLLEVRHHTSQHCIGTYALLQCVCCLFNYA